MAVVAIPVNQPKIRSGVPGEAKDLARSDLPSMEDFHLLLRDLPRLDVIRYSPPEVDKSNAGRGQQN